MKNQVVIIALIAVLLVLVAGSIFASFAFYKEYKDKIDSLEQQNQADRSRVEGLDAKFDNFKSAVDDITTQLKTNSDNLKAVQNTISLSEEERKNLLAKIEEMKNDLQGLQKDYSLVVIDIKQSMLSLKDDLDKMSSKAKQVELGKITVKQDEQKITSKEPEQKAKSVSTNFKSGNVRKVGGY